MVDLAYSVLLKMPETLERPVQQSLNVHDIEQVRLDALVPYPSNPRRHSDANVAKIAKSIETYGWTTPVLITDAMEVIAGHGRLLAAQKLGLDEVPCIRLSHLTPQLVEAYRIADNRLALDSDWDEELLAAAIKSLHTDPEFDIALTGFDPEEIDDFMGFGDEQPGEDETPEKQDVAVSKPGDIWVMNGHRLACGDCTDAGVVAVLLDGAKPNLMVTDPPYGVEYDASWRADRGVNKNTKKLGLVTNDDRADWSAAWTLFSGSVAYVWCASMRNDEVIASLESVGFERRSHIVWAKDRFTLGRSHYHWQHEPCWYVYRGDSHWNGDRSQSTIWEINARDDDGHGHSTQNPVECMRRPIVNHTISGDPVYDPFMGSGTTLIAAETTHRVAYGCEIEPAYVDMAVRRWQAFTGAEARLATTNQTFEEVANARATA